MERKTSVTLEEFHSEYDGKKPVSFALGFLNFRTCGSH